MLNQKPYPAYQPWLVWGLAATFFFTMYIIRVSPSVIHHELITEFAADATSLGFLAAYFYYSYLAMQIPAGILLDRFGPRSLLSFAVTMCAVSSYLLATSHTLVHANYSRLLLGTVSAFAFVGAIKLATAWFPQNKLGLVVGITQGLGMLGASFGQGPMAHINALVGWRNGYLGLGVAFLILAICIALLVRNAPKQAIPDATAPTAAPLKRPLGYFKNVLLCPLTWINALYTGFIYAPVEIFGEFWGVAYLENVHAIPHQLAANASSLIFIGWFIGGPIAGWVSNYTGRKPVMILSALCGIVLTSIILYAPALGATTAYVLMFLFGFTNGGLIASYTVASEMHPPHSTGLCMGITNMITVIIGSAIHPVIGALLDAQATIGADGIAIYGAGDYQHAMMLVPICSVLALLFAFYVKETLPKEARAALHA